ncbi:MAG: peptide-N-glycosidase F-related protein, partial [Planctomycetota bacterium]
FVVFDEVAIEFDPGLDDGTRRGDHLVSDQGRVIETTFDLPPAPDNQRDARQILAAVTVQPVLTERDGRRGPGDRWTRLGSIMVVVPGPEPGETTEVELMRFVTGFGGHGTFTQDLTALAPMLAGPTTLRLSISTYYKPAWRATLTLSYSHEEVGYRRPIFAKPIFFEKTVTAEANRLRSTVLVPPGCARPRLRILSTGHATDGIGGDEFVSRTHVLRIDGHQIAIWRPWTEAGGSLRPLNPTSGREDRDGRELRSSDLDRSGWHPGRVVQPLVIPVPELRPGGPHEIELEIRDIRPRDESGAYGYWRVSAIVVADEPWPAAPR